MYVCEYRHQHLQRPEALGVLEWELQELVSHLTLETQVLWKDSAGSKPLWPSSHFDFKESH